MRSLKSGNKISESHSASCDFEEEISTEKSIEPACHDE